MRESSKVFINEIYRSLCVYYLFCFLNWVVVLMIYVIFNFLFLFLLEKLSIGFLVNVKN